MLIGRTPWVARAGVPKVEQNSTGKVGFFQRPCGHLVSLLKAVAQLNEFT